LLLSYANEGSKKMKANSEPLTFTKVRGEGRGQKQSFCGALKEVNFIDPATFILFDFK